MGEAVIVAIMLYLGIFHHPRPLYLQCVQVDPQTAAETPYGYIRIVRKNGSLRASLLEWGPQKISKRGLVYAASGSLYRPAGVAIFDEQPSFNGHSWILTRARKGRYLLSEEVADPTRLDYCVPVRKKQVPEHLRD
jgi:hypothetical protein